MGVPRLVIAVAILAGLLGASMAFASFYRGEGGDSASYPVLVVGPDGETMIDATVAVDNATVLLVLQAAAEGAGVDVELEEYSGMGTYVRAIGGHRAHGMSGWIYEVRSDGGEWTLGDRSAEYYALAQGDSVRWRWIHDGDYG